MQDLREIELEFRVYVLEQLHHARGMKTPLFIKPFIERSSTALVNQVLSILNSDGFITGFFGNVNEQLQGASTGRDYIELSILPAGRLHYLSENEKYLLPEYQPEQPLQLKILNFTIDARKAEAALLRILILIIFGGLILLAGYIW